MKRLVVVFAVLFFACGGGSHSDDKAPRAGSGGNTHVMHLPPADAGTAQEDSAAPQAGAPAPQAGSPAPRAGDGGTSGTAGSRAGAGGIAGSATPPTPVIPHEDVAECWPEDQPVLVVMSTTADDCGVRPSNIDTVQTTFVAWWNSDSSCNPVEQISDDGCTRVISRVCEDSTDSINTTYTPGGADDADAGVGPVLVTGTGTVSFIYGGKPCKAQRIVEIYAR